MPALLPVEYPGKVLFQDYLMERDGVELCAGVENKELRGFIEWNLLMGPGQIIYLVSRSTKFWE
jgi:hypothetical protein